MHFKDSPDSVNGLGIPGNIWFRRFAVTHTLSYPAGSLVGSAPFPVER